MCPQPVNRQTFLGQYSQSQNVLVGVAEAVIGDELDEEILEIDAAWRDKAGEIDAVEIGLEKTDIAVEEIALVWIPRG